MSSHYSTLPVLSGGPYRTMCMVECGVMVLHREKTNKHGKRWQILGGTLLSDHVGKGTPYTQ